MALSGTPCNSELLQVVTNSLGISGTCRGFLVSSGCNRLPERALLAMLSGLMAKGCDKHEMTEEAIEPLRILRCPQRASLGRIVISANT